MKLPVIALILICGIALPLIAQTDTRGEVIGNPGFEDGWFSPWYHHPATTIVTLSTEKPHSGNTCAKIEVLNFLAQDLPMIPTDNIQSLTYWVRIPEAGTGAHVIEFYYSDGTDSYALTWGADHIWQQFDIASELEPGKKLVTIVFWGYTGGGPRPDVTYYDDVSMQVSGLALEADTYNLFPQGGTVNLQLDAGIANMNRDYLILGGMSETEPGIALPGGLVTLPINWDNFTDIELRHLNGPIFTDFLGVLDGNGQAVAQLNVPSTFPPAWIGQRMYFAYLLGEPYDFVSNAIWVEFVPDP